MKSSITLLSLMALVIAGDGAAQICKWVDENGVTHYAETCPEDYENTKIQIEAPPTEAQVEEASSRSADAKYVKTMRKESEKREREQKAQERQIQTTANEAQKEICIEAIRNKEMLGAGKPVYIDENNKLHLIRSLHFYWYEGEKAFLNEAQRQAEITRTSEFVSNDCKQPIPIGRLLMKTYLKPPNMSDTLSMLQWPQIWEPLDDVCHYARHKLNDVRERNTGIPSTAMRELEDAIDSNCN